MCVFVYYKDKLPLLQKDGGHENKKIYSLFFFLIEKKKTRLEIQSLQPSNLIKTKINRIWVKTLTRGGIL